MARIQLKRGTKANLPSTGLLAGEPLIATDKGELFVATNATTTVPVVPPVASLSAMGTVDNAADLLLMYDTSATASKKITVASLLATIANATAIGAVDTAADTLLIYDDSATAAKKITVADFLTALAIPADKKVAVVAAGTPGYLYGTNGTDGVLRVDSSLAVTKDAGDGFITLAAAAPLSGSTSSRPVTPATGTYYFDTTLGQPIWYSGTGWVDATGADPDA